ncbi:MULTISPECIES: hypothetical protein [unclassified Pseudomonas]|uniref:hypothetical protein n=1 Tax=unclassified Pseudomonas TaxID=196821 RepID=UPI00192BCA3A|nr:MULTISPECIES: hypothetical protein [unclassified Pseudomonas]QQZ38331.1 hypothetical protein IF103_10600 [Pseudomonas sp. SK2]WEZ90776.1 hypothetical protein P3R38_11060 [Pseudomonas sp. NyZ480]
MEEFSFFVAHDCPGKNVDKVKVFGRLKEWMERRPARVDRCGGKNGKLVKFNEKKYLNGLQAGGVGEVSLYSERIWGAGEVDEFLNCDFSAGYSSGSELLLSSNAAKLDLQGLIESFWAQEEVVGLCDYAYAYSETQAYGFGYGIGVSMIDDEHPLLWKGHARVGMWRKMQWAGRTDELIRDVYPFNIFSERKIEVLPQSKSQALVQAMERFGESSIHKGFSVWRLDDADLEKARDFLKDSNLLASYLE